MKHLEIFPKTEALIFDLDGTLADTMPIHYLAYKNILKKFGIDFSPKLFASLSGVPVVETVHKINELFGTKMNAEEIGYMKEEEYERNMHSMKLVEPVAELVVKNYGKIPMSVGTGSYKRLAWKTMNILGLDKYIHILVSFEDVKNHKPHPETFLKCAELMNVTPGKCQVFEDGILGIEAAKAAGMSFVDVTGYYEVSIGKKF